MAKNSYGKPRSQGEGGEASTYVFPARDSSALWCARLQGSRPAEKATLQKAVQNSRKDLRGEQGTGRIMGACRMEEEDSSR